ncbi:MAG TPA: hypothetical protein VFW38_07390 [Solirubrobacteraceae bacterium]|nr:hypothetical protein [Solirubrobacteraceae bacterium]
MIASVHICAPGAASALRAFRGAPDPKAIDGLAYAETLVTAPVGASLLPKLSLSEVGLLASWQDDEHLDRFLGDRALAGPFAEGWHVRMRPVRVVGAWKAIPGLPATPIDVEPDEPVAVLTLGRLRKLRLIPFLRAGARAEAALSGHPGLLAATGFAHPPHIVSTFSLWRSSAEMLKYAQETSGAHLAAIRRNRERPFHHESAFIRMRPYRSAGTWGTTDPLLGVLAG